MAHFLDLLKLSFKEWKRDEVSHLSAALAYYTIFSLAPFLILLIFISSLFLGDLKVQDKIIGFFQANLGGNTASTLTSMLKNISNLPSLSWTGALSFGVLLLAAVKLVNELQFSLNRIWKVRLKENLGWVRLTKRWLKSFVLITFLAILIILSLAISALAGILFESLRDTTPSIRLLLPFLDFIFSFGVFGLFFGAMFRYLPEVQLKWRDVWKGGFFTGGLFFLGKMVLGLYFAYSSIGSTYGLAGSVLILLLWIYYSSLILLFGAEFTHCALKKKGVERPPSSLAEVDQKMFTITPPSFIQQIRVGATIIKKEVYLFKLWNKIKGFLKEIHLIPSGKSADQKK